jgi:hypothetical protein
MVAILIDILRNWYSSGCMQAMAAKLTSYYHCVALLGHLSPTHVLF